jgi:hypothetical protein
MESADAFELKAQALNKDPRLASAGISALRFAGDKNYIADGEFSPDLPPPTASAPDSAKSESDPTIGRRLRIVLRMSSRDAYELKAQALNDDPRLKEVGIAATKFTGDKQYISGGEFTPEPAAPSSKPVPPADQKVRVVLRGSRQNVYKLVAMHLNDDPALAGAGISGVALARGAGMVPFAKETPAKPRKRSFAKYVVAAVVVGLIGVTGAGALFFSSPPAPTPQPTATENIVIPVSGDPTPTHTPVPATDTSLPPTATRTPPPTATSTPMPTLTVVSCEPPSETIVAVENLSCRYGPGADYLYRTGLLQDMVLDVLGKADTAFGTWIRVQTRWETPVPCWVNSSSRFVEIPQGDVACLESLYPEKAPLIIYNTDLFPKPRNVSASRSGNLVFISWTGHDLLPGDKPPASMRYLVETWTCQDGEMVFTPFGTDETFAQVRDDGGCDGPARGQVYMAHVDGYIGPVIIPWPP